MMMMINTRVRLEHGISKYPFLPPTPLQSQNKVDCFRMNFSGDIVRLMPRSQRGMEGLSGDEDGNDRIRL